MAQVAVVRGVEPAGRDEVDLNTARRLLDGQFPGQPEGGGLAGDVAGERVPVEHSEEELERVRATVSDIAGGILKQRFEPTPSPDVCRFCDYRIICPAAEK